MDTIARCSLCGEPMPAGEGMFKYHGYSGPCPKPPLKATDAKAKPDNAAEALVDAILEDAIEGPDDNSREMLVRKALIYGEQCRRAGAEAMREAAADLADSYDVHGQTVAGAIARGVRALPSAAEAASTPSPWRLVPIEPTVAMVEAGRKAMSAESFVSHARVLWVWEDMLKAAAPSEEVRAPLDPRDPDPSRPGIFRDHNCSYCQSGKSPCIQGNPNQCEYPHARND